LVLYHGTQTSGVAAGKTRTASSATPVGGGEVLSIVGYMGRLCEKGVPFLSSWYTRG